MEATEGEGEREGERAMGRKEVEPRPGDIKGRDAEGEAARPAPRDADSTVGDTEAVASREKVSSSVVGLASRGENLSRELPVCAACVLTWACVRDCGGACERRCGCWPWGCMGGLEK